jgi:tripartite ATP-independent transporter DctP family solute receptor
MRKVFAVLLVVCLVVAMTAPVAMAKGLNLKLAHVVNEKDAFHLCALKFKEIVEKETDGNVTVTIFPNAKLGDERALLEGMKMGVVDAGIITSGPFINFVPEFGVFDLPFLFRSPEHAYTVLDGHVGKSILKKMESQGWKGLAYGERGFRNLTNSKRPVRTPEDMEGLKIRLMQNPVYVDSFKALGANAVPMAWTEALTALQQKTIDGQENPLNVIVAFKLYESQQYLSLTRHAYAPNVIMMSMKSWNKLTPEQQEIVQNAALLAAEANRNYDNSKAAEWVEFLKEQGMEVVEDPDLEAFREAVQPVYDKYGTEFADLLEQIEATEAE